MKKLFLMILLVNGILCDFILGTDLTQIRKDPQRPSAFKRYEPKDRISSCFQAASLNNVEFITDGVVVKSRDDFEEESASDYMADGEINDSVVLFECEPQYSDRVNQSDAPIMEDRPFSCAVCTKTFKNKKALNIHKRIHTGERPYACKYEGCKWAFSDQSNLAKHRKSVHCKVRKHTCSYSGCKEAFFLRADLKRHYSSHSDERPFICSYIGCSRSYKRKDNLKRHLRDEHGEKNVQ